MKLPPQFNSRLHSVNCLSSPPLQRDVGTEAAKTEKIIAAMSLKEREERSMCGGYSYMADELY